MQNTQSSDLFFTQNRAFRYGDGIFETIIFENSTLKLWDLHLERLKKGIEILKFEAVELNELETQILAKIPDKNKNYRIRLQLWRADGGLYTPLSNQTNSFIAISDYKKQKEITILEADFAKSIQLNFSTISTLKTCNALPYILANIEKKERNLGEIVILSTDGFLAECSASNLFWVKENTLFTPSLSTGCIAGVMRQHIINQAKIKNIKTEIGTWKPEDLQHADLIFSTNVTGIKFLKIGEKQVPKTEIDRFLKMLK